MSRPKNIIFWFAFVSTAILALRVGFPERPMDSTGPRALLDLVFVIWLLASFLLLAGGVGWKIIRSMGLSELDQSEKAVFGLGIGFAVLAYGVMALGLAGFLRPELIFIWLLIAGFWSRNYWMAILRDMTTWLINLKDWVGSLDIGRKTVLAIGTIMLTLSLIHSLTPPWDYDGLMYHLQAPIKFLEAGQIYLMPDLWQANGPFAIEMLFTIGLAFGSDVFAKLIHLSSWVALVVATFLFGKRFLGRLQGWLAATLLMGVPVLPLVSGLAYVDVAWALYEFLAFYSLILWRESKQTKYLVLAGLLSGAALGTKYLAIKGIVVLGLWVVWKCRNDGWRVLVTSAVLFGGIAVLVGSPWYIKNWIWSGNPVFPFVWGGPDWDESRLALLMSFMNSFGNGRGLIDFLISPWSIYTQHSNFSTIFRGADFPSLLFPLAIVYPFTKRNSVLNSLAVVIAANYVLWFLGTQQIRFLIPIFPGLSLLTSHVLVRISEAIPRPSLKQLTLIGLPGGMLLVALIFQVLILGWVSPLKTVIGLEEKRAFLSHIVSDFTAMTYIRNELPPEANVLMLWNGQGYYCGHRCRPDADQTRWIYLTETEPDYETLSGKLRQEGVTHILISGEFQTIVEQDETGKQGEAVASFYDDFVPGYTREVYEDFWVQLFELTGPEMLGVMD